MTRTCKTVTVSQYIVILEEFISRKVISKYWKELAGYYTDGYSVAKSIQLLMEAHPDFEKIEIEAY